MWIPNYSARASVRAHSHGAFAILVLSCVVAGCTQQFNRDYGLATENRSSLEVSLPVAPAQASECVVAAAVAGGWTVTSAQAGVVTVGPYRLKSDGDMQITMHANVVPADSGSRVVVSGVVNDGYRQRVNANLGMGENSSNGATIREATKGRQAPVWGELQRFADAIRAQSGK